MGRILAPFVRIARAALYGWRVEETFCANQNPEQLDCGEISPISSKPEASHRC